MYRRYWWRRYYPEPGQTLGVVGPIGSKSTFVESLMRLLDVAPNTVFVGGEDITNLTLSSLRVNTCFPGRILFREVL